MTSTKQQFKLRCTCLLTIEARRNKKKDRKGKSDIEVYSYLEKRGNYYKKGILTKTVKACKRAFTSGKSFEEIQNILFSKINNVCR
jgi:hypothetical protein